MKRKIINKDDLTKKEDNTKLSVDVWKVFSDEGKQLYETKMNYGVAYQYYINAKENNPDKLQFFIDWSDILLDDEYEAYDEANVLCLQAEFLFPNNPQMSAQFGKVLYFCNAYSQAVEKLSNTINLEQNHWQSLFYRGICYFHLRKNKAAIQDFDKAIKLIPKDPLIIYKLFLHWGQALIRLKKVEEGKIKFIKAISLKNDIWETYFLWGDELQDIEEYKKAFNIYSEAYEKSKKSSNISDSVKSILLESLSFCAQKSDDYIEALEFLVRCQQFENSPQIENSISYIKGVLAGKIQSQNKQQTHKIMSQLPVGDSTQTKHFEITNLFKDKPNIKWSDIIIELVSKDSIRVKAPKYPPRRFNYTELGMKNYTRGDLPNRLWELLIILAEGKGNIGLDVLTFKNRSKIEKKISDLQNKLKNIFGLSDNPISRSNKKTGYTAYFIIRDCRGESSPDTDNSTY